MSLQILPKWNISKIRTTLVYHQNKVDKNATVFRKVNIPGIIVRERQSWLSEVSKPNQDEDSIKRRIEPPKTKREEEDKTKKDINTDIAHNKFLLYPAESELVMQGS